MQISCTPYELKLFEKVTAASVELGQEVYLIGGFVRDKLLGRITKDADIVSSGDAIELARAVAARFDPSPTVSYFKNFGTAHIKVRGLDDNEEEGLIHIEFFGARK